jgi:hypothetical protein
MADQMVIAACKSAAAHFQNLPSTPERDHVLHYLIAGEQKAGIGDIRIPHQALRKALRYMEAHPTAYEATVASAIKKTGAAE